MKKFNIRSLLIKEILADLAREFETSLSNDCDVYNLNLPSKYGEGRIGGINFSSGIGIITYDCKFKIDLEICFTANEVHPAKFLYITEGKIEHGFIEEKGNYILTQHQSAIVASTNTNGHRLIFRKNHRVRICNIEIDRLHFIEEMECDVRKMDNALKELFLDVRAKHSFHHKGSYSLKLFDMLREMDIQPFSGLVQRLSLLSTSSGILREQILQYEKDQNHSSKDYLLRRNDVELVKNAVKIINDSMASPTNIEELAKAVHSNPTKLQQNFKMVYGTTVNGYTKNARLEKAAALLLLTDKNITEIVKEVGLINRGYFSKLFKERYKSTPNGHRMKFKKKYID